MGPGRNLGTGFRREGSLLLPQPDRTASPPLFPAKWFATFLLLALAWIVGCANPGPPRPPTLRLPAPAKSLLGERVGDHVVLSWQTSAETTDGQAIRGTITAEVCRDDSPKSPPAVPLYPAPLDPCKTVYEGMVAPSTPSAPTQVVDRLPSALAAGPPRLIAYRVMLRNGKGRSAEASTPVYALAGTAPHDVGPLEVLPRRNGALIRWEPSRDTVQAQIEVTRTLVANGSGPVEPKRARSSGNHAATPQQVTLTYSGKASADTGGLLDHGIHDGETMRYVAQRVLTVELTPPVARVVGRKGTTTETKPVLHAFELKSEPSPAVTFAFHDTIPPDAPVGLVAVTGSGFAEAPSIDLSWEPGEELDIAGYNVYRAAPDGRFERVNRDLLMGPAFHDPKVEAGKTYSYRVTAIDQHHNESAPSAPVKATVRKLQGAP